MARRRSDEDFDAEIQAHLALETERLMDEGLSRDEARDAARRAFGNMTRVRERFRDARPWSWLEHLARDLRYGWRALQRSPAFVATTVVTLAVGISLVTIIFTIFNAYALRPFAVRDPQSLVGLSWQSQDSQGRTFQWAEFEAFRSRRDVFDAVVAESMRYASTRGGTLSAAFVSGGYFRDLGVPLLLGRGLSDADLHDAAPVAVLSHEAWSRLFDRDPGVIGRELEIQDQRVVVIGVTRPEFEGLDDSPEDAWLPITSYQPVLEEDPFTEQARNARVYARLAPGVTAAQAQGAIVPAPFAARVPGRLDTLRLAVATHATPVRLTFGLMALLSPVFAAFALVLVAACANASNVMLARAQSRQREIAVRLSLGASRGRVVRQLLAEGLLIASLAGALGVFLADLLLSGGLAIFFRTLPPVVAARARVVALDFDVRVFAFSLLVATAVTLLFALLPALQATRLTLTGALRGQVGELRSSTLRSLLVGGQVAVSMVLLIVAATLVRNGLSVAATDLGVRTAGVTSINQRGDDPRLAARAATVLARDPRIALVAMTSQNPLFGQIEKLPVQEAGPVIPVSRQFVTPDYFPLMEIPILRGRTFRPEEAREGSGVAIISAATAAALWPGEDPIGHTLRIQLDPPAPSATERYENRRPQPGRDATPSTLLTIVGVAKDVVSGLVYEGRDSAHLYMPTSPGELHAVALLGRARAGVRIDAGTIERNMKSELTDAQTLEAVSLDDMLTIQMFPLRMASWVGSVLAAVALVLSLSGLYGVLTYVLGQRRQEIGIRMALGASAAAVVQLVMRQSARLAMVGGMAGLIVSFAALKILAAFVRLQNVALVDPVAFAVASVLAALAVAAASYAPARRATQVDPARVLRTEA